MRDLTINRITLPYKKNEIKYSVSLDELSTNKNDLVYTFKSEEPHHITSPYEVVLVKSYEGDEYIKRCDSDSYTIPTSKKMTAVIVDAFTFKLVFRKWELIEVSNLSNDKYSAALRLLNNNIYELVNDTKAIDIKSMGKEYQGFQGLRRDIISGEYVNEEDWASEMIMVKYALPHIKEKGNVYIRNTWHLNSDGEFDNINIKIYEDSNYIASTIGLSTSDSYKLDDDNVVTQNLLNELSYNMIPEVTDNEKRQFLPVIAQGQTFKMAYGIEFNLHFRSRIDLDGDTETLNDKWKTTDEHIWNGFTWSGAEDNSSLHRENANFTDDYADELNHLGFTEDDVKYQKTKIKKSFIRLLFYSSKNMFDRELLYYSTIFLDSGKLYSTYCNIKNNVDGDNKSLPAFDKNRTNNELRLSASFAVNNKYNTTKSSEGFYLYLFPNEVDGENNARTIYMKVEFNHAGFGKTIPMMLPRKKDDNGNINEYSHPIESTSKDFPTSFIVKENIGDYKGNKTDFEWYENSLMIPVNIVYSKTKKAYLYYFPWYNRANENKIIINLWEPRVRGDKDGNS